jgi:hypothetical protein
LLQLTIEGRNFGNRLRWDTRRKWRSFEITKTLKSVEVTFESTSPCEEPRRAGAAYKMVIMIPNILHTNAAYLLKNAPIGALASSNTIDMLNS